MYIYNIRVEVGHTYLYAWYTGRNQQKRDPGQKRMRYSIDTPIVVRKSSRLLSSVAAAPDIATSTFSISNTHVSELCVCACVRVCALANTFPSAVEPVWHDATLQTPPNNRIFRGLLPVCL